MFYHTVVLHLFRPFLKVDLTNSKVSPRGICTSCASSIASLVSMYRQMYGLRRSPLLIPHVILSSSIIHLLNLPNPLSARDLANSITAFREMDANHAFATRAIHVVTALANQWTIHLPADVAQAAYDPPAEVRTNLPREMSTPQTYPPYLSPISNPQQPEYVNRKNNTNDVPFSAIKNSLKPFSTSADMFWSPFPDHIVPLQVTNRVGPMDISAMLDVQNTGWDQLDRDGFKVATLDDSILGPLGYNQPNSHWAQA